MGAITTQRGWPQTTGTLSVKSLHRPVDGPARPLRDRPDHRRRSPRPVPRPGLRPRPGADVADGALAPDRRRAAVRAVRQEPGRHGPLHPDARLARRRAARPRAMSPESVAILQAYADGVNAWIDEHNGHLSTPFVVAGLLAGSGGVAASRWSPGRRSTRRRGRRSRRGRSAATSTRRSSGSSPTPGSAARRRPTSCSPHTTTARPSSPRRASRARAAPGAGRRAAYRPASARTHRRWPSRPRTPRRSRTSPASARRSARSPASTAATASSAATASARTTGSSRATGRTAASRSSPTTRTSASGCRRSGS